jgi:hypothetical protein
MQRRTLGLLLGAVAAYGIYKYSKMSPTDKANLKTRGRDFLDKQLGGLGDLFGRKKTPVNSNSI